VSSSLPYTARGQLAHISGGTGLGAGCSPAAGSALTRAGGVSAEQPTSGCRHGAAPVPVGWALTCASSRGPQKDDVYSFGTSKHFRGETFTLWLCQAGVSPSCLQSKV